MLVRQLEEEVVKTRAHAKETNPEIKAHIESLQIENDALTREVAILKETTKVRESFGLSFHIPFMDVVQCGVFSKSLPWLKKALHRMM